MSNISHSLILEGKLDKYLNEEEKTKLLNIIDGIKRNYLYKSDFHGLHHSEKVLLFAYLLGRHEGLSVDELEILMDAAIYHDVGRMNEAEEELHGFITTRKLDEILGTKPLYKDNENMEILKAICDSHSVPDSRMKLIFGNYDISEEKKELFFKLARLLKDADALDRTRFRKTSTAALKEEFLRFDYSKSLVELSHNINDYYRMFICDEHFEEYSRSNVGELTTCLHGIGFNFSALDGILDIGILSEYAKKKFNLKACRNFNGNNGDLWISVCQGEGEAKKLFVDNGIYFECLVPRLIKGEKVVSVARSKGLPIDSGRYQDERFAFHQIPLDHILSVNVNPEILNMNINLLNYLNGSSNYEALENNINAYLYYLRIKFGYFPNIDNIVVLKQEFLNAVLVYEKLDIDTQKKEQQNFFKKTDLIKSKINHEIANMIQEVFSKALGKENVTVLDVVTYIINSKNINYTYSNGKFTLNTREKKI